MAKEWDTYVENLSDLKDGEENSIFVRSLAPGKTKYKTWRVKAVVAAPGKNLRGGDTLYIKTMLGKPFPEPWKIKINEQEEVV